MGWVVSPGGVPTFPNLAKSIMNRRDFDIDHIDPVWEDGRDYQLVCGFKRDLRNLREEDPSFNTVKSNRFLPWRWAREEIGVVPEEPGDLAYFLVGADIEKDIPGEWVLMEFLSEEWFEATKETSASFYYSWKLVENAKKWRAENPDKVEESSKRLLGDLKKWQENNPDIRKLNMQKLQEGREKFQEQHPNFMKELSSLGAEGLKRWAEENPDLEKERIRKMREGLKEWAENNPEKVIWNKKFRCTVTGKVTTAGPLTMYQKKRGIDPSNREPVN